MVLRITLLFFIWSILPQIVTSQGYVIKYPANDESLIIDEDGTEIFSHTAWHPLGVTSKINRWPIFLKNNKRKDAYAKLDRDGTWTSLDSFQYVSEMGYGRAIISGRKGTYLVTPSGRVPLEKVNFFYQFNDQGFAIVGKRRGHSSVFGLIDTFGNWQISAQYIKLTHLGQHRYEASDSTGRHMINSNGDIVFSPIPDSWKISDQQLFDETGHRIITIGSDNHSVILDVHGNVQDLDNSVESIDNFHNGAVLVQKDGHYQFMDEYWKPIGEDSFLHAMPFSDKLALVEDPISKCLNYYTTSGELAFPLELEYGRQFKYGLAVVRRIQGQDSCNTKKACDLWGSAFTSSACYALHEKKSTYFEVIDTTGEILWSGNCKNLHILDEQTILLSYGKNTNEIIRLGSENRRLWANNDIMLAKWDLINIIPLDLVNQIDLNLIAPKGHQAQQKYTDSLWNQLFQKMSQMPQLKHLTLRFSGGDEYLKDLSSFRNLKSLDLSSCKLNDIPWSFRRLDSLEELDLSWNSFEEIPKSIYRMKNLKILKIHDCFNLSREELDELVKALPGTEVVLEGRIIKGPRIGPVPENDN